MAAREEFPFPFVGSGDASYFEWGEVFVYFARLPKPAERKQIEALVPAPLRDSRRWQGPVLHAASGQTLHHEIAKAYPSKSKKAAAKKKIAPDAGEARWFFATDGQVTEFNADITRWLVQAHAVCPILVAYRAEDGESGGTKLDAWHRWSVRQLPTVLPAFEPYLAPDAKDAGVFVLEGVVDYARRARPAIAIPKPFESVGVAVNYRGLIAEANLAGLRAALRKRNELTDEGRQALVHGGKWTDTKFATLLVGVSDVPAVRTSRDRAVLSVVTMAAVHLRHTQGTSRALKASADAALAFVEARIAKEPMLAYDFGGYAFALVGAERWEAALETYELALRNKHNADVSTYNNALWHVNPAVNGMPLDVARAKHFLTVCVPHGEDHPNLLVNAAYLYLSMGDEKKALAHAKLAVKHGYDGKGMVAEKELAPLRKLPAFLALGT